MLSHNNVVRMRMLLHKVCKAFRISVYFQMDKGIKGYNRPLFKIPDEVNFDTVTIAPTDVYLSYDGLKDEYTHVEKNIADSPHVDLIRRLKDGHDICNCEYVHGEINGCLDGRFEQYDSPELIKFHRKKFIESNTTSAPLLYLLCGKYYVLDGKHRLATAVVNHESSVVCRVLSLELIAFYQYTIDLLLAMRKYPCKYKKNIAHLELILNNLNR